ncbi:MAG TPA: hypothetical protein VHA82_24805 [Ramlibacter sp.]|uniref:hypothetical protein n=1 Tax=Ramlibacter sp. TaxID=1917967 RepID=UPI002BA300BA|nr:hypothetical protein [Ramlibacter sp.]HVZ47052.1 hypothetical protein [Ramlibacter sp.]
MGLFSSKTDVQAFARELAGRVAKRYPPELDKQAGKRPSVNRLTRIMEDTCSAAVEFRDQHKLGWFGRARLGNAFKWELTELGYSTEFVDFATEAVVVHLSRKASAPAAPASGEH